MMKSKIAVPTLVAFGAVLFVSILAFAILAVEQGLGAYRPAGTIAPIPGGTTGLPPTPTPTPPPPPPTTPAPPAPPGPPPAPPPPRLSRTGAGVPPAAGTA